MQKKPLAVALGLMGLGLVLSGLPAEETGTAETIREVRLNQSAQAREAPGGPVIEIMALDADGTNLRQVASIANYPIINSPEVSPDGEWIGVDGWKHGESLTDAHLLLVHLKTGIVSDLGPGAMPTWSSDGRWIAYSRYRKEGNPSGVFIGTVTRDRERLIDEHGWAITWSPDGQKLAYVKNGDLIIYDIFADTRHEVFGPGKSPYRYLMHNPEWSPDSRRVCFIGFRDSGKSEIATVSAEGLQPDLQVCCDAKDFLPDIGWRKDGRWLTLPRKKVGNAPGQLWVFDLEDQGEPTLLAGQPRARSNLGNDWSPDGKTLYFVSVK